MPMMMTHMHAHKYSHTQGLRFRVLILIAYSNMHVQRCLAGRATHEYRQLTLPAALLTSMRACSRALSASSMSAVLATESPLLSPSLPDVDASASSSESFPCPAKDCYTQQLLHKLLLVNLPPAGIVGTIGSFDVCVVKLVLFDSWCA